MGKSLLRLFLGLVLLSAGLFRIFNWNQAVLEFSGISQGSAYPLLVFTVALEIIGGLMLVLDIKTKQISFVFILFIIIALIELLAKNWQTIIGNAKELFFLNPTPTDFFLHFTYLIILIYLFLQRTDN